MMEKFFAGQLSLFGVVMLMMEIVTWVTVTDFEPKLVKDMSNGTVDPGLRTLVAVVVKEIEEVLPTTLVDSSLFTGGLGFFTGVGESSGVSRGDCPGGPVKDGMFFDPLLSSGEGRLMPVVGAVME